MANNLPENTQYFSAVDPAGNSLGFSNIKDIMGKPYFAYRNPGDTATTTDMTRVATTFDPRVPQPLTSSMLQNGRLPEVISKTIKNSLGGTYSDELDHTIALELSGSNNPANLRIEPGINTPGVTPGESASFDTQENDLAHKVVTGQISLFDAQVQLTQAKRTAGDQNPVPWTPTSPAIPPATGQPIATTQSTTTAPNQPSNPYAGVTTMAEPTKTAQFPSITNTIQSVIPSIQKTVSNQTKSLIGSGFNPNVAVASTKTTGFNPNASVKAPDNLNLYKEDYVQPLWAGGTDSADNIAKFDMPTYLKREATFAVPFTLLSYGLIDAGQAKVMAINALNNQEDTSSIPKPGNTGLIPLDAAKKAQQQWAAHDANPEPVTFSKVMAGIPQAMSDWGKGILPDFVREFGKGLVGGGTAGLIPGTEASPGEDNLSKLANFGGNLAGMFTGIGALGKIMEGAGLLGSTAKAARAGTSFFDYAGTGVKALDNMMGYEKALNVANDAAKTAGLVSRGVDYGTQKASSQLNGTIMGQIARNVGLLTAWNNIIGVGGRELTGQQQFNLGNHMKQFWTDLAYGSLLGSTNQSIRGYAGVGLGSTMISLITGNNIQDSLKNGALMTALHTMGYSKEGFDAKGKTFNYRGQLNQIASDQAYKMSAVTFDQYGQPIETVKVGQGVPQVLQIAPETIDQLKAEYKQTHPNDTRFDDLENTNSAGAIQLMSRNARAQLMDLVARSDGAISQDQVKQELTRIVTSENALSNQTLPPEERVAKQTKDLISMGEKLKPQTKSEQLRFVTNASDVFDNTDFHALGDKPNGENFNLSGPTTIVGYGGKMDLQAKQTIDDMAKNPSRYQSYVVGVNDQETINYIKLINQEINADPVKWNKLYPNGPTGDPNDTIRFFALEKKGGELIPRPIGYMPKIDSYTKVDNVNKTAQDMVSKGKTGQVIYDSNLNAENVANEMRKNGKNYVVTDISQIRKIGQGANSEEPYIEINFTNRNVDTKPEVPFESPSEKAKPITEALKKNAENVNAQKISASAGEAFKLSQTEPIKTLEPSGFTKEEIKSLKKQGFSEEQIKKLTSQKIITKPLYETYNEVYPKTEPPVVPPKPDVVSRFAEIASKEYPTTADIEKAAENRKTPSVTGLVERVQNKDYLNSLTGPERKIVHENITKEAEKKPQNNIKTEPSVIQRLVDTGKLTTEEAEPIIDKEKQISDLSKEASSRYLTSDEKEKMLEMGRSIKTFLEEKGLTKAPTRAGYVPKGKRSVSSYESALEGQPYGEESSPEENDASQRIFEEAQELAQKMKTTDITKGEQTKYQNQILELVDRVGESNPYFQQRILDLLEAPKTYYSKIQDSNLVKKYGLQTKDDGYLKFDRNGKTSFSEEYKKDHPEIGKRTPEEFWGPSLTKDLQSNKEAKTLHSENFMLPSVSSITEPGVGGKIPEPYDMWSKTIAKGLKKMVVDPQEPWLKKLMEDNPAKSFSLNTLMDPNGWYMKNKVFKTLDSNLHGGTQPLSRIIKQVEGASPKELSKIDEKTISDEQNAAIARAERGINTEEGAKTTDSNDISSVATNDNPFIGYTVEELKKMSPKELVKVKQEYDDKKFYNELTGSNFSPEDLKDMSIKDITQATKVQDLTPFEMRFPSLIYEEQTGKLPPKEAVINDGISFLKDLQSRYNAKVKNGGKILKFVITDENTKKWNPDTKKMDIVSGGWDSLRKQMLEEVSKKSGGQGGPGGMIDDFASGISDAWGNVKNFLTNTTHFVNTPVASPQTYDVRGLKVTDSDLSEAAPILFGEASNRTPDKQQFEVRNMINTAINRSQTPGPDYGKTLTQVLQRPAQYQGYAPNGVKNQKGEMIQSQYQIAKAGKLDAISQKKMDAIQTALNELKSGKFADTTGGSTFYVHASDGTIWLGKTQTEAQKNAANHESATTVAYR